MHLQMIITRVSDLVTVAPNHGGFVNAFCPPDTVGSRGGYFASARIRLTNPYGLG
jgi:hypothetical protein